MELKTDKLISGIDTVIVRVKDVSISKRWYEEKLGFVPFWDDADQKLVVLNTYGPTSLSLWQTDQLIGNNAETTSFPIFKSSDAFSLWEQLRNSQVETGELVEDEFVKYFTFLDPDGNLLEACEIKAQ